MAASIARRGLGAIAVLAALILFTFVATNLIGDPIGLLVDRELATDEDIAAIRAASGLDKPLPERFARYASDVLRGDFGTSLWQNRPASEVVLERIPATLLLAGVTVVVAFAVSVVLAMVAVWQRGRWPERAIILVSTALACIPPFWLSLMLILLFAVRINLLPTSGYGEPRHLILPVSSLAALPIGHFTQVLYTGMLTEIDQQYVRTARAKGLRERAVIGIHVLRNSAILATTMIGSMLAVLVNGAVLAEAVFAWPGVGNLGLAAVQNRDLPVLTAVIFYAGCTVTLINLLVDLVYIRLDPRIHIK
jgi:peptide/nickel transport system permease protein